MSAGIGYKWKELLLGAGITNVLQPMANYASTGLASNYQYVRHYTAFAQYKIRLIDGKFNITPQLFMRKGATTGYQFDGTLMLDYKNIVFLGGGYRNPFGVIAMAGVNVFNMFTIAYAYDYTSNSAIAGYVGSTSEITAGFHLASNYRKKYNRSAVVERDSFNRLQKQADKLAAKVDSVNKALNKSAAQVKSLKESNDSLSRLNEKYKKLADSLSKKVDELFALKSLSGENTLKGNSYRLDKIFFDYKKADLLPESKEQLNKLVDFLKKFPNIHIMVTGYTDVVGGDHFNIPLSYNRSKSVAEYLIENGIKGDRIEFEGLGSSDPVADNNTEAGRKLNRRVEFAITKE